MTEWAVVIFRSTHLALRAEDVVKKAGLEARLIPAPRHLSHDCGVALRVGISDVECVAAALTESRVEYEHIAELE